MAFNLEDNPLFAEQRQQEHKKKIGRPKKAGVVRDNSVQEGLTADYTRATFIVRVDLLERLKDYVYTERTSLKEEINEILEEALKEREKKLEKEGRKITRRDK